jgi:hypothetical protein
MKESRATQRGQILELLISVRGDWVPLPKMTECAAQYNARIFEPRGLGLRVENRTKEIARVRHRSFSLVTGLAQPTRRVLSDRIAKAREWLSVARGETQPSPVGSTGSLFRDLSQDRSDRE